MKAQDVFDAIDQLKPNDFNRSEKRGWLKQLEQMILREIIIPHGGTVEDVELTERGDGILALRVLLTADGESAALEMTVRGA